LQPVETRVESAWFQRLKLKCEEPLSNLAFKFALCRYVEVSELQRQRDEFRKQLEDAEAEHAEAMEPQIRQIRAEISRLTEARGLLSPPSIGSAASTSSSTISAADRPASPSTGNKHSTDVESPPPPHTPHVCMSILPKGTPG